MIGEAEIMLGQVIDNYRLKRILGKGGSSIVFLGQRLHDPHVQSAIKILWPSPSLSAADISIYYKRFLREAQILQERLRHPHIVPVLAYGEDSRTGAVFMVMPYIKGETLTEHARKAPLPLNAIASYVIQLAEALDYAHQQQVLHRDLKPNNVLLDAQQHVYLLDFGIAKVTDSTTSRLTVVGGVIGTPDYMAPEQARGGAVSALSDIYGLGALTYTLVTGQGLFPPAPAVRMLLQVLSKAPTPPRSYRPDLPSEAEAVILRALSKEPAERFMTAGAFAEAFVQAIRVDIATLPTPSVTPAFAETLSLPQHMVEMLGEPPADDHYTATIASAGVSSPASPMENARQPVSRRVLLLGGIGLLGIGAGVLWAANTLPAHNSTPTPALSPTSSVKHDVKSSSRPTSQTAGTGSQSTPTPAVSGKKPAASSPPVTARTTPMTGPALSVTIVNLPPAVVNNTNFPLALHTSLAQSSVVFHVTYPLAGNTFTSPPVTTDDQGLATLVWPVRTSGVSRHRAAVASIVATATDKTGQQTASVSAQIDVIKGT